MKVVITGGTGFVGARLARRILDKGTLAGPDGTQTPVDEVVLFDVMVSLLQDQLRDQGVSEEDFGHALDEEACSNATRALMNAILSFSPKSKAKLLKKAFGKVWKATIRQEQLQLEQAMQAVNSAEFDRVVEKAVEEVIGGAKSSS